MMHRRLGALITRDLKLAWRVGGNASLGVAFFLAVIVVVPFGVGSDPKLLARIGPAMLWLAALLSMLLGLDRLFQTDQDDGSLDLVQGSGVPLEMFVLAKVLAYWLATGLPLVIATPLLGLLMMLSPQDLGLVALTLLIGTPALSFLGAIGAAITVSLRRGGILLTLLVLPLTIPLMIFGVGATSTDRPFGASLLMLAGLALFSVVIGTFASAAALKLQSD